MSSVRAVSDTEYSEGNDNSGRGLSAREEGLTTIVGDPGSGSAYFYRDPDPGSGSAYFYRVSDPGSAIRATNSADLKHCFKPMVSSHVFK